MKIFGSQEIRRFREEAREKAAAGQREISESMKAYKAFLEERNAFELFKNDLVNIRHRNWIYVN
jgi:hypothetical protein